MEATTDESKAVVWAMEVGLLGRSMLCPQCAQPMRLNARNRYWRCCRKTRHADGKQEQFSIFVNSWFSKMKLELSQALRLMFAWCMRAPQPQAAHMAKVSENTAPAWYAACRVLCSKELWSGEFKIGGEGHIVEIDETSLKKKSKAVIRPHRVRQAYEGHSAADYQAVHQTSDSHVGEYALRAQLGESHSPFCGPCLGYAYEHY
ncbi:hypothetical protein PPTG_03486 [Phytophthora nicotianae INRA-310]|uniref:Uncharacterized protein n=1 Tax=Phytophthora nicotianae (strain INRA-310) TaxID=761204 RepID=W2R4Z8_PHYN3|nr:hypothetical protein PPTG_03486 [Phytophthora nicotianae INRA-310]ETN20492.1 hypothetical protein PPTG_03486 [Phytophthora nicotianae INRA-310]